MYLSRTAIALLLVATLIGGATYAQEDAARGKIITVGEDRIVVAVHDGGQMTFEVANVKDGDQWVKDRAQIAQIQALRKDQTVEVRFRRGDGGHLFIAQLTAGPADQARQGFVAGKVITTGEGRVVIASDEGGQMTLEPSWIRRQGKYDRDPFHMLFGEGLKAGDEVIAMWELDEGTHYIIRGISKVDPAGQALALVLMQAQLRETYQQINQLQNQINELQNMLRKALEPKPAQ